MVVEEDFQFLESVVNTISRSDTWEVIGGHLRAETALKAIIMNHPAVVITGIKLPGMSGIQLAKNLKAKCPMTEFILVTEDIEDHATVFEAFAAGASGYVYKRDVPTCILDYLTDVLAGGAPMSSAIARKVVQHFHLTAQVPANGDLNLTPRETETLRLLTKGYLYKEMAKELEVTVNTIAFHVGNIYRKLQVGNRSEAILKCVKR